MLNEAKELTKEQLPSAANLIDSLLGECWLTSAKTARSATVNPVVIVILQFSKSLHSSFTSKPILTR